MKSSELMNQFPRYHSILDEYVSSAKVMDEQTFRQSYEKDSNTIPFCYIQLPSIALSLYRSRLARSVGNKEDLSSPQTFSYVPGKLTNEHFPRLQRANFSGQSVFYGSLFPTTNFREICEDVTAGEEIYMAKWNFSPDANLVLYRVIPSKGIHIKDSLRKIFHLSDESSSAFENYFQKLGGIMMNTEDGIAKYLVSALCANFVYEFQPKVLSNGMTIKPFDGIIYPSTKMEDGNELNFAIKPETVDRYATLQYVVRGKVAKDLRSIDYSDIGFCNNGKIHWYSPWINHKDIVPTAIYIWDNNNRSVDIANGILYDKLGKVVADPQIVFDYQKDQWAGQYIKQFQSSLRGNYNIETLVEDHLPTATFQGHAILREVDGWKFVSNGNEVDICKIGFSFEVTSTFRKADKPIGIRLE